MKTEDDVVKRITTEEARTWYSQEAMHLDPRRVWMLAQERDNLAAALKMALYVYSTDGATHTPACISNQNNPQRLPEPNCCWVAMALGALNVK